MTTPTEQRLRPSPPFRYLDLSREHLEKAAASLDGGDALQASEDIWCAVANALKAVAQQRGWNHRFHNHLRAVAYYLADERSRPDWNAAFRSFESLHTNYYEHQDFVADVRPVLTLAQEFCREMEQLVAAAPPSWESFTPEQQQVLTHRLRELTRQLSDRAAFGDELTGTDLDGLPPVKPPHTRDA